jgi:hypothetical protein
MLYDDTYFDTHELAWAAGFFDGEGTVMWRGKARKELYLSVAQADIMPLERFARAVGFPGVRGPYEPKNPNGRLYFVYSVSSHIRVQAIVAMLWKFLSDPKREQAAKALNEALPYVRERFVRGSRGRSVLSMVQATELRNEYAAMKEGRQRIPKGARELLAAKYGLDSVHTLAFIVAGKGYSKEFRGA